MGFVSSNIDYLAPLSSWPRVKTFFEEVTYVVIAHYSLLGCLLVLSPVPLSVTLSIASYSHDQSSSIFCPFSPEPPPFFSPFYFAGFYNYSLIPENTNGRIHSHALPPEEPIWGIPLQKNNPLWLNLLSRAPERGRQVRTELWQIQNSVHSPCWKWEGILLQASLHRRGRAPRGKIH